MERKGKDKGERPVTNLQKDNLTGLWTLALHLHLVLPIFNISCSSLTLIHNSCWRPASPAGGARRLPHLSVLLINAAPGFYMNWFWFNQLSFFCLFLNSVLCGFLLPLLFIYLFTSFFFFDKTAPSWMQPMKQDKQKCSWSRDESCLDSQTHPDSCCAYCIFQCSLAWPPSYSWAAESSSCSELWRSCEWAATISALRRNLLSKIQRGNKASFKTACWNWKVCRVNSARTNWTSAHAALRLRLPRVTVHIIIFWNATAACIMLESLAASASWPATDSNSRNPSSSLLVSFCFWQPLGGILCWNSAFCSLISLPTNEWSRGNSVLFFNF